MNTVAFIIAIGTFAGLAFMPMLFTLPESRFRKINMIGGWVLSVFCVPCIYLGTGYPLIFAGWLACGIMAVLSRIDLASPAVQDEEPPRMEFADMPRMNATERIQNLERLAKLRATGMISAEEFEAERKNFLG